MNQSTETNELITALVNVQGQLTPAKFDAKNPFFKSNYATLNAVWDSCRVLLSKNGLAIIQTPTSPINESPYVEMSTVKQANNTEKIVINGVARVGLTTRLAHTSGQWLEETYFIPFRFDEKSSAAQAAGSIITYLRRYSLAAMLGIVSDEDTDGEPARNNQLDKQNGTKSESTPPGDSLPSATKAQLKKLHTIGTKYYGDEWDDKRPGMVWVVTDHRSRSSNDLTKEECSILIGGIAGKFETDNA